MAISDYTIDTTGTPQEVQRKQKLAEMLMQQGGDSTPAAGGKGGGWMTALNRGLAGALGGYQQGVAANQEQQGRDSVRQMLASQLMGADGKINPQSLLTIASNPWATQSQIGAVGKVADLQHQASRDAETDRHTRFSEGIQTNADKRAAAAEGRAAKEYENTPDQYEENPKAAEPGQPKLIDRYAEARAAADQSKAGGELLAAFKQRKQIADAIGMDESHPGFKSFMATGKMPREDAQPLTATDKKAILDAEEKLQSSKATIANLQQAKKLSPQAMQGPGASTRGYFSSFLGGSSDLGKAGIATQDLENLVTTNALQSLKSIFGVNPTEGERAILLDVQGSVGKPDAVRQKIYDRAIEAANRRIAFEQQRVDELRGGAFYKPQGGLSKGSSPQAEASSEPVVIDGYTIKAR